MPYIGRGPAFGVRSRFIYTATASQTSFSGNDDAGITLAYTDTLYMDVYQNGVLLVPATDYAASTGTSVVLVTGASADDTVEMLVYDIFSVADSVSAKDGGTFSGTIAAAGLSTSSLGTSNFRAGVNAGNSITAGGNYNVTVGDEAGTAITTGDANTFVGFEAGKTVSTASENTAFGYQALKLNAAGDGNTAIGVKAMDANVIGDRNVAVGADALGAMNPDSNADMYNVAVGYNAGAAVTTGISNTLIGGLAGDAITSGDNNVAMGYQALTTNILSDRNVAIGNYALATHNQGSSIDSFNVAVGFEAGLNVTTGSANTLIGGISGDAITTGADNVAVGYKSLTACIDGGSNTAIGKDALEAVTSGNTNVGLGKEAGDNVTTGSNNILIGNGPTTSQVDSERQIVMGRDVVGNGGDFFTFGDGSTDSAIGFGATSIIAPSDVRLKEDIQDETVGLGFVNDLRPVTFQWKKEKDIPEEMKAHVAGSEKRTMNGKHNHGFIAQEVKAVIDKYEMKDGFDMWTEDETDGRQRIGDASLMPIMVKALQELSEKNDALEARLAALEAK